MKRLNLLLAIIMVVALAVGCAPKPTATPAPEAAPTQAPPTEAPPAPAEAKHPALADNTITIAWIPKALNNPGFEIGKVGAETKAAELTKAGPY